MFQFVVKLLILYVHLVIKWCQVKLKNELPLIRCITNSTFDPSSHVLNFHSIVFGGDSSVVNEIFLSSTRHDKLSHHIGIGEFMGEPGQHPFYGTASRTPLVNIFGNHHFSFLFFDSSFSDLAVASSLDVRIRVYIRRHNFERNSATILRFSVQRQMNNSKCFC